MSKQFTSFPEEIKALRKQLGENQGQFGKHFGVSHAAVSDWESGKSEAPYKVLEWALLRSVEETPASPTKSEEYIDDLKPFKHGEEGTHFACQEMIKKYGDKVGCCGCIGHNCKQDQPVGEELAGDPIELRAYITNILLDVRGDNEYPENEVLRANVSLLFTYFQNYLSSQKQNLIREVEKAFTIWKKQGRTKEQIWAVENFLTGAGASLLKGESR